MAAAALPAGTEADGRPGGRRRRRVHLPHLGLRARITLAFTVSAALLSTLQPDQFQSTLGLN